MDGSDGGCHRPLFHYTRTSGWMNDPNGPIRLGDRWHLFHQAADDSPGFTSVGWGHASSADLLRWREEPPALTPLAGESAYSGSVALDPGDSSGLGEAGRPPLLALFTAHRPGHQSQHLAASTDGGATWRRFAGNPVLDENLAAFRDPFLFAWPGADGAPGWGMLVALPCPWSPPFGESGSRLRLYRSDDARRWNLAGELPLRTAPGELFECPALVPVPVEGGGTRLVLLVSLVDRRNGDAPGHVRWCAGRLDAAGFHPETPLARLDHGPDWYAAQPFAGAPDGRAVAIGWMSSWDYARVLPVSPWAGGPQSLPRDLRLDADDTLRQSPPPELAGLHGVPVALPDLDVTDGGAVLPFAGDAYELHATIDLGDAAEVGLALRAGAAEGTLVGLDGTHAFLDRHRSGRVDFHPRYPGRWTAPHTGRTLRLTAVVDRCSVELFLENGAATLTALVFPGPESLGLRFYATGGTARLRDAVVWPIRM
ncbi:MAG TPA: glycoside hydrolase family 32 protein [Azospirillaceae bacterium]|nr:glycoside hydrolase family 32 protein [Azospirillaceae bacterium]